jgi:hypothetical protein
MPLAKPDRSRSSTVPSIVAVLAFRNEGAYLANALRHLASNGIHFALIDNESNDNSRDIAFSAEFAPYLADFTIVPFDGTFDLSLQLEVKARVIAGLDADWVIHCDADEIMHSHHTHETLSQAIARVDRQGFNVVDFNEFVFLPVSTPYLSDWRGLQPILSYYFFNPGAPRLMRAWK